MGKENIKPNYYRKIKDYKKENINSFEDFIEFRDNTLTMLDSIDGVENYNIGHKKAQEWENKFLSDGMNNYFNCPGFKGGGYCGNPTIRKTNKLSEYYPLFIYGGRPEIKLEVLNKYRLCVHTIYVDNYKGFNRSVSQANSLKVLKFRKGRNQNGYNFYIREYPRAKRVYAGSIIYTDDLLANNVIYAIRQLYYIGLSVNSIATIIKYLTRYKGLDNLGYTINLVYG